MMVEVMALALVLGAGANLANYDNAKAVHIWSTDYYQPIANPEVRTLGFNKFYLDHAGQKIEVCVRSAHNHPGTILWYAPRLTTSVEFHHGRKMRLRCAEATVRPNPILWPGLTRVQEGTFVGTDTEWIVEGWIRKVAVR